MKRSLTLAFCFWLGVQTTTWAQMTTVVGMGIDRAGAINDAKRNAVSQVIGTYIDSRTISRDAMIALDEIYAQSYGFVKGFEITEEGNIDNNYRIKARVDVDTAPDSALLDKIALISSLNDPKILVTVTYDNPTNDESLNTLADYCRSLIADELIKEGLRHVIAASSSNDAPDNEDSTVDYIVNGRLTSRAAEILLPKYTDYTNENSDAPTIRTYLSKAVADMDVSITKTDTKETIGEFRTTGEAMHGSDNDAIRQAVSNLATRTAKEVYGKFTRAGANVGNKVEIVVRTEEQSSLTEFERTLTALPGVQSAYLKNFINSKGTFAVDTDLKPAQVFRLLKEKSPGIFMERVSANVLEISI